MKTLGYFFLMRNTDDLVLKKQQEYAWYILLNIYLGEINKNVTHNTSYHIKLP